MVKPHRSVALLALALALIMTCSVANAAGSKLSLRDAKQAAVAKVRRLERKLVDTGARSSGVPGCWRKTRRAFGCLGMVRGEDELVRWRCAVPMTVRRRSAASASSKHGRIAVEFTDTMCAF